jgi:cytochrome c553
LGERIYRGGIADRQIAACAGCHSPTGAGIPSQYPRLAGQHADYAVAQLTAFRDGVRKNNTQMTQVAAKLNDREIKAVSDYIAGLR